MEDVYVKPLLAQPVEVPTCFIRVKSCVFLCLFRLFNISTHKWHHMMWSCGLIIARAERNIPARVKSRKSASKQDEDKPGGMRPLQSCSFSKSLSEALRTRATL